jgi:hypothetical protein
MNSKDFPWSQFQLIDAVTAAYTNRFFRWGEASNTVKFDGKSPVELKSVFDFIAMGNFVIATQPDECGEVKFKVGDIVVERSSGIFAQEWTVKSIKDGMITLSGEKALKDITVHAAKLRGNGVAFLPSNVVSNIVDITGAPINDDFLINSFLFIALSNNMSSIAWTELRYIAEVPEQDGVPNCGHNFYNATIAWAQRYEKSQIQIKINDIVIQSLPNYILSGNYGSGDDPVVGTVVDINTSNNITKYLVKSKSGKTHSFPRWDVVRLIDAGNKQGVI